jgi:hypothetical protein
MSRTIDPAYDDNHQCAICAIPLAEHDTVVDHAWVNLQPTPPEVAADES